MKTRKALVAIVSLALGLMLTAPTVLAATFVKADKESGLVTVSQQEPLKNLYTAGAVVTVDVEIEKNLYVAGGTITVNKPVGQTLNLVGGTVFVRSDVGGSAHLGGGNVIIDGKIADDLIVGGGTIAIGASSEIGGDLIVGGGNVIINAPVKGNILIGAGQLTINSKVAGTVKGQIENLTLGAGAEIGGDLIYKSAKEAKMTEGATVIGRTEFTEIIRPKNAKGTPDIDKEMIFGFLALAFVVKFLAGMAVGLILVYLLKKLSKPVTEIALTNFWPSLGIGFAAMVMTPVALIILASTIIGLGLAGLLAAVAFLFMTLAAFMAQVICGSWLIKVVSKSKEYRLRWQEVVIGALALSLFVLIPVIGWLAICLFVAIGLGALIQLTHRTLLK